MSIYDHPHKPGWQMIKISHGRKEKAEYIPFQGTKEKAQIWLNEMLGVHESGDPGFADKLAEFKISYQNLVSADTMADFGWAWLQLEKFFQSYKIRHITDTIIELYKSYRLTCIVKTTKKNVSKRTVNRELSYLSKYLEFCGSSVKPVKFPKKTTKPEPPRPIPMDGIEKLAAALPPPFSNMVRLMAFNGLRRNEVLQIRAENVEADGGLIRVLGKGNKWRVAPVEHKELKKNLAAIRKKTTEGWLWPNPKTGRPYKDIRHRVKPVAEMIGLDQRIYNHLFRHSFGTALVRTGQNLRVIQDLLGHADLKTTQIYTHLADDQLRGGTASLVKNVAKVATGKKPVKSRPKAGKQ